MRRDSKMRVLAVLVTCAMATAGAFAAEVDITTNITASETWTSNNEYILTQPIYVTNGATLTIEPGTVVRGEPSDSGDPNNPNPGTLIIARGSKLRALGTVDNPIVFTDLFDDNVHGNPGTDPYDRLENALGLTGQWGGVILLGRSYVANNTLAGPNAAREVQIEGLTSVGSLGLYGNGGNDDDDSGTLNYVSIRYGGFNLAPNNEINGLTLGAVGRLTDIDFVEVMQNKDDGVEFFGGTVNVKHLIAVAGGDDSIDYDEGYRGKGQFILVVQGTPGSDKSDKGAEQDGGNNPDGSQPFATPAFYNVTMVGLGGDVSETYTAKATNTALHFRDNAAGRYYNSFIADFGGAPLCIEGGNTGTSQTGPNTSGERAITTYAALDPNFHTGPGSAFQLELEDNTFFCTGNGGVVPNTPALGAAAGCDTGKEYFDNGVFSNAALDNQYLACGSALPIRALVRIDDGNAATPNPVTTIDPRPAAGSPLLTTNRVPPADGFFDTSASYRGAVGPVTNWAAGWSTLSRLTYLPGTPSGNVIQKSVNITASETWTSNNEYVLTQPIYVTNGATLTIDPGTVVRGEPSDSGDPNNPNPGTLIIARGSKLRALGTAANPIVFTDLLDDNVRGKKGTPPYDTLDNALGLTGQWGGVILLGRSYAANNTLAGPSAAREVQIEGLTSVGSLGLYGNGGNDDDDSGTLNYVSIRYGGFNLAPNNEINGLTLGAVGRLTDIDFVEVMQNKDDGVEFFGGTVNVKHVAVINGGDDSIDYDEGFRGKGQFIFAMQGTPGSDKSDKGAEQDGGNNPDGSQPFATPAFYNVTMVGLGGGAADAYTAKATNTALHFRDNAAGRYYNSFIADFGGAPLCIEGGNTGTSQTGPNTSGERAITTYAALDPNFHTGPGSAFQLELEDNTFFCTGNGGVVPNTPALGAAAGCDTGKEYFDNGVFSNAALDNQYLACGTTLPILGLHRLDDGNPATPNPIFAIDPRPATGSPLLTTNRTPPADGFFSSAPYRGAFEGSTNWLGGWSTTQRLGIIGACDTGSSASVPDLPGNYAWGGPFGTDNTRFEWSAPTGATGTELYDVLRSASASNFTTALCLETDDSDTSVIDVVVPAVGDAFFYLVRAGNLCGDGGLGANSAGVPRTGASCP